MSEATLDNGHMEDRLRAFASLTVAFVLHVAILVALALGLGAGGGATVTPPITIDLQASFGPGMDDLAASAGSSGSPEANAGTVLAGPAARTPPVRAPSSGSQGSMAGGFVIPVPRGQPSESKGPASAGPAFREVGGKTGVVQDIPSVSSPLPAPNVAPVTQGKGSGSAAWSGGGTSSVQHSGTGVAVSGTPGSASGGSLDLSHLDKALAGGKAGNSGSASGGSTDTIRSAGTGGSGGAGSGNGQGYSVHWGEGGSGKGRTVLSIVYPKLPEWVSRQGLTLTVTVDFTLLSDGLIGGVSLQQSCGYADVDAAVLDALRRWRFSPAEGAAPAHGFIPWQIRL
jgi:TonB family protein